MVASGARSVGKRAIHVTKQSNGWFLSCSFAIPLRSTLWQKCNLKTTVYRGVRGGQMSNEEVLNFSKIESQKDVAYRSAGKIFRVGAYIYIGLLLLMLVSNVALMVLKNSFTVSSLWNTLINPISLTAVGIAVVYLITADFIKGKSPSSVVIGRVVAAFSLILFPIGTVIGIIALIRLFNKNL